MFPTKSQNSHISPHAHPWRGGPGGGGTSRFLFTHLTVSVFIYLFNAAGSTEVAAYRLAIKLQDSAHSRARKPCMQRENFTCARGNHKHTKRHLRMHLRHPDTLHCAHLLSLCRLLLLLAPLELRAGKRLRRRGVGEPVSGLVPAGSGCRPLGRGLGGEGKGRKRRGSAFFFSSDDLTDSGITRHLESMLTHEQPQRTHPPHTARAAHVKYPPLGGSGSLEDPAAAAGGLLGRRSSSASSSCLSCIGPILSRRARVAAAATLAASA